MIGDALLTIAQNYSVLKGLTHTVDKRGYVTYCADGNNLFRDEGRSILVLDPTSERAIGAALATAQAKFGNTLTLTGSEDFKRQTVAAVVNNHLSVRFSDPGLNEMREQMLTAKMRVEREWEPKPGQGPQQVGGRDRGPGFRRWL